MAQPQQDSKTTAESTTEQPETDKRDIPCMARNKRQDQSARRSKVNQSLEEMKHQYNSTGEVENYSGDDLEREIAQ